MRELSSGDLGQFDSKYGSTIAGGEFNMLIAVTDGLKGMAEALARRIQPPRQP